VIEPFYGVRNDLDNLSLAAYLAEVGCDITGEGEPAVDILRLLLNSLFALSGGLRPPWIVKGAFELRAAGFSGFMPELDGCAMCDTPISDPMYLDVMNGALLCADCLHRQEPKKITATSYDEIREAELLCRLSPSALAALRYASYAPLERIFSFELKDGEDVEAFSKTAESYLLSHLGRGFDSLNFYHTMKGDSIPKGNNQ
jgi:DNA repair protein RecO (recombination protein O)